VSEESIYRERKYQLYGWLLFLVCAILFIIDSLINWSPWGFIGSVFFFLGCIVFIIPFTWKKD
jgi:hypothetical protein